MAKGFQFDIQSSQIPVDLVRQTMSELEPRLQQLQQIAGSQAYDDPASSVRLPSDAALVQQVNQAVTRHTTPALRYVIVVGIGGSNLGTMAICDALRGLPSWPSTASPKLLFADTVESTMLHQLTELIQVEIKSPDELIICVISKSGKTTETIANSSIVVEALEAKFPDGPHHLVAITDDGSKLHQLADQLHWTTLTIPKPVGGRYSVLSAVGLFPLALVGIDIELLLSGARDMRDECLKVEEMNPAIQSAAVILHHRSQGKGIHDTFLFRSQLESVGKWYRQLTGESLGKEKDASGKTVHMGITPSVSVGSTDLHSVGQLYLGGPTDKVTTFITADVQDSQTVPAHALTSLVDGIVGKRLDQIQDAILEGIRQAYTKRQLPYMLARLSGINERTLGMLLQWKMIEIMLIGYLLNVNPFDQPNVEEYKTITRSLLERE